MPESGELEPYDRTRCHANLMILVFPQRSSKELFKLLTQAHDLYSGSERESAIVAHWVPAIEIH
jgi:hypothetical protein